MPVSARLLCGLLACGLSVAAQAAGCDMRWSAPSVDLGQVIQGSGWEGEVPGFRSFGHARHGELTATCESPRNSLRLAVTGAIALGSGLLRWDAGRLLGGVRLTLVRATADGLPVGLLKHADGTPAGRVAADGALPALDLSSLPRGASRFTLEWQVEGFIENGFVPVESTTLTWRPRFELLDP